jgi:hypothetical protein
MLIMFACTWRPSKQRMLSCPVVDASLLTARSLCRAAEGVVCAEVLVDASRPCEGDTWQALFRWGCPGCRMAQAGCMQGQHSNAGRVQDMCVQIKQVHVSLAAITDRCSVACFCVHSASRHDYDLAHSDTDGCIMPLAANSWCDQPAMMCCVPHPANVDVPTRLIRASPCHLSVSPAGPCCHQARCKS